MNEADANVLKVLRKSTMSSLSDAVYSEIEKAVDKDGIRNLKGTARDAVAFAVRKYNMNHDSSNGQFASGSGGSSASSSAGSSGVDSSVQRMIQRGAKALQGNDYKAMMSDYDKMEAKHRKQDLGDPQDLASGEFHQKYGAFPEDVSMVAEAWRGRHKGL